MDMVNRSAGLTDQAEFWQQLANNIPQLAWVADASGWIYWYNQRWFDYTGTTLAEMEGWGWKAVHHPDHIGRVVEKFSRSVEKGERWEDLFPLRSAGGEFRWFLSRANPICGADGKITHWFGTNTDVTEQQLAEAALRETSDRMELALDAGAIAGTWTWDVPGDRITGDERFARLFSLDPARCREGMLLEEVTRSIHPDDYPAVSEIIERTLKTGGQYRSEYRVRQRDGSYRWVEANGRCDLRDGKPTTFPGVFIDISDRKRQEEALRLSETAAKKAADEVEAVYATAPIGLTVLDTEMRYVRINEKLAELNGVPAEAHIGRTVGEIVPDLADQAEAALRRVLAGEEIRDFELVGMTDAQPGVVRTWRENWLPLRDLDGKIIGVTISAEEITDQKSAEEALRKSEYRYRTLFESMDQGFCILRLVCDQHDQPLDYLFVETNPAFERQSGIVDAVGKSVRDIVPGLEKVWFETYGKVARTGEPVRFVEEAGDLGRWFEVYAFRIDAPELRQVAVLFTDISDRVRTDQALRSSEARLRAVIEAAPIGLVFADASGRITGGNARIEEIIAHPLLPSENVDEYRDWVGFHADGRQVEGREYPLARVLMEGLERAELEVHYQRGDGRLNWIRFIASPVHGADGELVGGVVASLDIDREKRLTETLEREVEKVVAERAQAQEALRQSQKLEAMGQLTGGVAHDFNNLLTPIIGSLDLLSRKQVGDERTRRLVDGALQSAEKAKVLVQRLLAFARRQPLQPTAVDLGKVVGEMTELIASTSGPRIKVDVATEPDLPRALADSNQLEMALLNLSVNARDAMPDGGTLSIAVREEGADAAAKLDLKAEPHLVLSVTDSGCGMDEETLRRAIEPFFSTKGVGKGTGLGLSMVHGLAAQLGGALRISSRPGLGTAIDLWLPVAHPDQLAEEKPRSDAMLHSRGTVLLVDDEELVRMSTSSMLADMGFEVVEANTAEAAIALIEQGLRPSLLVTDHLMPGASGTELATTLRQRLAELPVLVVSGYAEAESLTPTFPYLSKPFREADLATAVASLLGEAMDGEGERDGGRTRART